MDRLAFMEMFVRVVEAESFSVAARKGGVSRAVVSKYLANLEAHLGVRLINRTTRQLHLTAEGEIYYQRCQRILEEIKEAELTVTNAQAAPSGLLRVSAPMSFGTLYLTAAVVDFLLEFPGITMDMVLNDRFVDLVDEGFDVGVRIGTLGDSSLIAHRLAPAQLILCASPAYVARHGAPEVPEELVSHACLLYSYTALPGIWRFQHQGEERVVRVKGPLQVNNGEALRVATLEGLGLALLPAFLVEQDLRNGALLSLMPDFVLPSLGIYAVYPSRRYLAVKVRKFIDFLVQRFGNQRE